MVAGLAKEYEVARANEAAVERALAQSKADIQGINRKEFQLGVLEREVQQNRNLYDMFVNRLKETSAAGDLQIDDGARRRSGDRARRAPFAPNKSADRRHRGRASRCSSRRMLALLLDRLANTLNSTSDVESGSAFRRSACCRRSRDS